MSSTAVAILAAGFGGRARLASRTLREYLNATGYAISRREFAKAVNELQGNGLWPLDAMAAVRFLEQRGWPGVSHRPAQRAVLATLSRLLPSGSGDTTVRQVAALAGVCVKTAARELTDLESARFITWNRGRPVEGVPQQGHIALHLATIVNRATSTQAAGDAA